MAVATPDVEGPPAPPEGKRPHWEVLPLSQLDVDNTYQRPLTKFVETIVADFDYALIGVLCVSQRTKTKYMIIDGQTRAAALDRLGFTDGPCLVYTGLKPEDEASLFARFQTERKSMASALLYKAQVRAKVPHIIAMNAVIEGLGFRVNDNAYELHDLQVPGALKWIFQGCKGGKAAQGVQDEWLLATTLQTLEAAYPTLPKEARGSEFLKGLALFIHKNRKSLNKDKLVAGLARETPDNLMDLARLRRRSKQGSGSSPKWLAEIIGDQYRKARP